MATRKVTMRAEVMRLVVKDKVAKMVKMVRMVVNQSLEKGCCQSPVMRETVKLKLMQKLRVVEASSVGLQMP